MKMKKYLSTSYWQKLPSNLVHYVRNYNSFALHQMDRKILKRIKHREGKFVELGANNGIRQSNTFLLERDRQWTGILIEPIPEQAEACKTNRPRSTVFNLACVDPESASGGTVTLVHCDLMSFVPSAFSDDEKREEWRDAGEALQNLKAREITVPCCTLDDVLDKCQYYEFDLLSLDVEGFELSVLKGLSLDKYKPKWILVEVLITPIEAVTALLSDYYELDSYLSPNDAFFRRKEAV